MAILGLDVGTTACKAVAFSEEGNILGSAGKGYQLRFPRPGWAELDPEEVWNAVRSVIREAARGCPEPIEAIGVSSQGEAVVALDRHGNALSPIIVSFDRRSLPQTEYLRQALGDSVIYAKSGQILAPMGTATKILWMGQNGIGKTVEKPFFACVGDYIMYRLGVTPATDPSMAARTMLYDIRLQNWSPELLDAVGIRKEQLAVILPAGTAVGRIPPEVASELELSRGVTMVVGGHDQPCAMLGTGATAEGEAAYSLGTTETLICSMHSFQPELGSRGFPCYPHVLAGHFVTLAGNFTGGNLLQWFRDQFAAEEKLEAERTGRDAYDLILEQMPDTPSGLLVLPHFTSTGTPWNDPNGVGAILGLQLETTRGQFIRGLLEGVTFEILLNMSVIRETGVCISSCRAVGGGSRSSRLLQLKADVLGVPIHVPRAGEATCKGAALLAGQGVGLFRDPAGVWREKEEEMPCFVPDKIKAAYYHERLSVYRLLYPGVKSILQQ
jgi:xylulokinase